MNWFAFLYVFLLSHVKFLFAATIALATYPKFSVDEIFISSALGAISCFNIFYFISHKFYFRRGNRKSIKVRKKKNFKKRNRVLIKMKRSKIGFFLVCTLAPLFLSIPIGTVIVVKFFGHKKITYLYVSVILVIMSFLLAYLNESIFLLF
jgi:hypothetical protein